MRLPYSSSLTALHKLHTRQFQDMVPQFSILQVCYEACLQCLRLFSTLPPTQPTFSRPTLPCHAYNLPFTQRLLNSSLELSRLIEENFGRSNQFRDALEHASNAIWPDEIKINQPLLWKWNALGFVWLIWTFYIKSQSISFIYLGWSINICVAFNWYLFATNLRNIYVSSGQFADFQRR